MIDLALRAIGMLALGASAAFYGVAYRGLTAQYVKAREAVLEADNSSEPNDENYILPASPAPTHGGYNEIALTFQLVKDGK